MFKIPDPSPRTLVRFNVYAFVIWCLLGIPTFLWWKDSVPWVVFMSLYAILVGHFGAWDAARAEDAATDAGEYCSQCEHCSG